MEKVSQALQAVRAVLKRFYYQHHDKIKMELELEKEIKDSRVSGFAETKRKVVEALDYRITRLEESVKVLHESKEKPMTSILDLESRVDELNTIRQYVKGMVVNVNGDLEDAAGSKQWIKKN